MGKKKKIKKRDKERLSSSIGWLISDESKETLCVPGYTSLSRCPEIITACHKIAELIGTITIHLMSNTDKGDVRIVNELSRRIDIEPTPTMTRKTWMEAVVMNLLLYGDGNSVVMPHTRNGLLEELEPIAASRVSFDGNYRSYKIVIDGVPYDTEMMLHFTYNPDETYLWKGSGITVSLKDVANNLKQATATEKGFMESKWRPSLIIKVDAMSEEFAGKEGRRKLLDSYFETTERAEPWLIPAEQFDVEQVKPLTLSDLAINDAVELDKRTVASIIGVPPFLLGVGDYDQKAWNNFIQNTVRPICIGIAQEMTKKLIISPKWYLKFNVLSLMNWDLETIASVFGALSDRGIVDGNEVRDQLGMSPRDGLDELRLLENYIPADMIGKQKKLVGGNEGEE